MISLKIGYIFTEIKTKFRNSFLCCFFLHSRFFIFTIIIPSIRLDEGFRTKTKSCSGEPHLSRAACTLSKQPGVAIAPKIKKTPPFLLLTLFKE